MSKPVGEVSGSERDVGLLYRDMEPGQPLYAEDPEVELTYEQWYEVAAKRWISTVAAKALYDDVRAKMAAIREANGE